jgi:hypothetical protein
MSLTPPKRLFNITTLSTVMYKDVADDVKEKGYAAISHVWGNQILYPASMFGIVGVDWDIPLSNPDKISRLADAMMEYGKKYCWFDVLCMPQGEENQKYVNEEIPFMGDYYNGADMTLVLSDNSYRISEDFTIWRDMVSKITQNGRNPSVIEDEWMFKERNLLSFHTDLWFTRVWTFQEAILSKKVILVDVNGNHLNFSNVIAKLSYLSSRNVLYASALFKDSPFLLEMIVVSKEYKDGTLDLARVLSANGSRNCYKEHDRFYGVFGIIGYKDFVVDYDVDINVLNGQIVRYSYSKKDVSWMAVGGDDGAGFIQPMYKPFLYVGILWKEIVPCVLFRDNLHIGMATLASVSCREKFTGSHLDLNKVVGWTAHTFRKWGFDHVEILGAMMGYVDVTEEFIQIWKYFLDAIFRNVSLENMADEMLEFCLTESAYKHFGYIMSRLASLSGIYDTITIAKAGSYALIISGNADKGDEIMVVEVYDGARRRLGIVVSDSKRKGVCLLPRKCKLGGSMLRKFML